MREGCQKICICDELRACEQRVMEDVDIILPKCTAKSYREGYAAALDAAEAAVTAMPYGGGGQTIYTPSGFTPHSVVAAIRALKETP